MGKSSILAGALLIIAGIMGHFYMGQEQVVTVVAQDNISHSYPYNKTWENNGTLTQTKTQNSLLVIENTSENSNGVFESNKQTYNGTVYIERFSAKADTVKDKHNATITFYTLDTEGAVKNSETFKLTEKNKLYNLNTTESFSGYSFDINLETSDSTTPKVEQVKVEGRYDIQQSRTYGFKDLIVIVMILSGLVIASKR